MPVPEPLLLVFAPTWPYNDALFPIRLSRMMVHDAEKRRVH